MRPSALSCATLTLIMFVTYDLLNLKLAHQLLSLANVCRLQQFCFFLLFIVFKLGDHTGRRKTDRRTNEQTGGQDLYCGLFRGPHNQHSEKVLSK